MTRQINAQLRRAKERQLDALLPPDEPRPVWRMVAFAAALIALTLIALALWWVL